MTKARKILDLFICLTLFSGVTSLPAQSKTISQSFIYNINAGQSSTFVSQDPVLAFDNDLGDLISVTLRARGEAYVFGQWDATNFPPQYGSGVYYGAHWDGGGITFVSDQILDGETQTTDFLSIGLDEYRGQINFDGIIKRGDIGGFSTTISFDKTDSIVDPNVLRNFKSTNVQYLSIQTAFWTVTECLSNYCTNIEYNISGNLGIEASIVYTYVTSDVPEPDAWIMLIAGFMFIGCSMRYRRAGFSLLSERP